MMRAGAVALFVAWPALVHAQEQFEARAQTRGPAISRSAQDATASTTQVDLDRRVAPLETTADVIAEIPGARVVETGGYGAFTSVSLRGNEPSHTTFLLGEAPLNEPETGSFDVSLLPLPQFERLEVYRGGAPIWLSQGAIAGVVRVLPRDEAATGGEARLGRGSFGLSHALLAGHVRPDRSLSFFTSAQVTDSDGDFPYVDDRSTRFDPSDDVERRLRNAQVTEGAGLSHLRTTLGDGELEVAVFGIRRLGGVPGAAGLGSNALQTRRALLLSTLGAAYTHTGRLREGRYRVQLAASGRHSSVELFDRAGELGSLGPRHTSDERLQGFTRAAASHELTRFLEATAIASYAASAGDREDVLRTAPISSFDRKTGAGALELRLFGTPLAKPSELRASVRAELTSIGADVFVRAQPDREQRSHVGQAHRLAASSQVLPFLRARASVGTGTRVPSADELFGDAVAVRPNTLLVPETGLYGDAGTVLELGTDDLDASAELTGFVQSVDDKILYVSTNQFESIAQNLGHADILGLESGLDLGLGEGPRIVASATLLDSEARFGRELPLRPRLRAHAAIEQSVRPRRPWADRVTAFFDLDHESASFYDQANEIRRDPLTKLGCGLSLALLEERLEISARVSDLLDARGQDYLRFPLPGRSLFVSLVLQESSR